MAIAPEYDADAVESLLQYVPAEDRSMILETFAVQGPVESRQVRWFGDPVLEEILERACAPAWLGVPDEIFEHPEARDSPGWATARRMREAEKKRGNEG